MTPSGAARLQVLTSKATGCRHLGDAKRFDRSCDVRRDLDRGVATCGTHPRKVCHVKDATMAIGRMGAMGKLSTSASLHLGRDGLQGWFEEACRAERDPHFRAASLVRRLSMIYRIGPKLASMYVTALSVVELTGTAPWSTRH